MLATVQSRAILQKIAAPAAIVAAYVAILAATASTYPGDTRDYADSIAAHLDGRDLNFWEFGHLLWRPLGFVTLAVSRLWRSAVPKEFDYVQSVHVLTALSIASGALVLLAFFAWLVRVRVPAAIALGTTAAMALSCAMLNYAQTGTAYVPALAMLCIGLWAAARADEEVTPNLALPALALAGSVLLWLPMILAIPAACASPLVLRGDSSSRRANSFKMFALVTLFVGVAYSIVVVRKGIHTMPMLLAWASAASHGISKSGGMPRAVVGFARSIVDSNRLGLIAKRYLLRDPLNPASIGDVIRGGLYRLALFYVLGVFILVLLVRTDAGRRALVFLAMSALPVLAFAVFWQGGDLERYLALFPALFLALAVAAATAPRWTHPAICVTLVAGMLSLNMSAYLRSRSDLTCGTLTRRLAAVPREAHKKALVVTPLVSDDLTEFRALCPEAAQLEDADTPNIVGLVTPHEKSAPEWRKVFAVDAIKTWRAGNRVWVSKRAWATTPSGAWGWAEGDEPLVHWRDFPAFFSTLEHSSLGNADDAFVEILSSPSNVDLLNRFVDDSLKMRSPFVAAAPRTR